MIVFWRVDRLVRKVAHLAAMIEWSEEHDVNLVSATESRGDLNTPFWRAIAYFVGIFAAMEAGAISELTKQTYAHNVRAGKYRRGRPPFGYRPVKVEGEWRLELDPVTSGTRSAYRKSEALCLRVVYRGVCGNPMYLRRGRARKYYACSSASLTVVCGNLTARREDVDKLVTGTFLTVFGELDRVYAPGADAAVELAEVDAELVEIAGTIRSPGIPGGTSAGSAGR